MPNLYRSSADYAYRSLMRRRAMDAGRMYSSRALPPYPGFPIYTRPMKSRKFRRAVKGVVKSMAETDIKITDVGASMSTTPAYQSLTLIAQGDGDHERIGNKAFITYITYRMHLMAADATNVCRIMLIRCKGYTKPDANNILDVSVVGAGQYWIAPMNESFSASFEKLYDRVFTLKSDVGATDHQKYIQGKIKVNKKIQWADDSGTTAVIGDIWIYVVSDSAVATHPTISKGYMDVHYKDI